MDSEQLFSSNKNEIKDKETLTGNRACDGYGPDH